MNAVEFGAARQVCASCSGRCGCGARHIFADSYMNVGPLRSPQMAEIRSHFRGKCKKTRDSQALVVRLFAC